MNNLSSYCGFTDSRMSTSYIDLPVVPDKMFAEIPSHHIISKLTHLFSGDEMATPRILGSDDEQDDNTSLSSNDDFSSNNSQVRHAKYSSYQFNLILRIFFLKIQLIRYDFNLHDG